MTRYAIDAATALRIIRDDPQLGERHALVGPGVLRSDVLADLYRQVRAGRLDERTAKTELDALATLRIRLLGDRVSRMTAFRLARRFDEPEIGSLEYLAVATLQADALVCEDTVLAARAEGLVPVVPYDVLR
ncbi:hypothetical protein [Microbacterium sp. GXF7504]